MGRPAKIQGFGCGGKEGLDLKEKGGFLGFGG